MSRFIIIGIIGISFMPNNSRVIRSATLAIKPLEFVQSARLRGEPTLYIMFREVLPNVLPVVGVEATIRSELRTAAHGRTRIPGAGCAAA